MTNNSRLPVIHPALNSTGHEMTVSRFRTEEIVCNNLNMRCKRQVRLDNETHPWHWSNGMAHFLSTLEEKQDYLFSRSTTRTGIFLPRQSLSWCLQTRRPCRETPTHGSSSPGVVPEPKGKGKKDESTKQDSAIRASFWCESQWEEPFQDYYCCIISISDSFTHDIMLAGSSWPPSLLGSPWSKSASKVCVLLVGPCPLNSWQAKRYSQWKSHPRTQIWPSLK